MPFYGILWNIGQPQSPTFALSSLITKVAEHFHEIWIENNHASQSNDIIETAIGILRLKWEQILRKLLTITSTSSTLMTKEADLLSPPPRGSIRRSSVATGDIANIVSYHSATYSSALRGNHYEVMAVQKGCHHAFCNPAAVKTLTRLTSPPSFKMSAQTDPCSFTVSFLLSLSWHWHILENGSHTFWSFGNHLLHFIN